MTKAEIKHIFDLIGIKSDKVPAHLSIHGTRGDWKIEDKRTKYENGFYQVYPIGCNQTEFYVVNPFNGYLEIHGLTEGEYEGHRSQGYCIKGLKKRKRPNEADRMLIEKIEKIQKGKTRRRLKVEEKRQKI